MKRFFLFMISVATIFILSISLFACAAPSLSEIRIERPAYESGAPLSFSEQNSEENEGDLSDNSERIEENEADPPTAGNEAEKPAEATAFSYSYPSSPYETYTAAAATATVNVRKGAGTSYPAFSLLSAGRSLPYLWEENGWFAVWAEGRVGFVSRSYAYLSETNEAIERILSAGLEKLSAPYEWGAPRVLSESGAENPYFTGRTFDCSSFVQYCFYVGDGVKLGSYTGSQADHTVGTILYDYTSLSRGDIFFTGTNGKISHVVLYLGGGRLLQCYSANGGPVSLTTDERWKGKFISGRRVDLSVKKQFA